MGWYGLLFFLLLLYFFLENRINRACLSSFRAVIHVNGIRGKTSTCRCLDAALRTRYRVFTKTTGTDAKYIDVSGTEHPVRRLGPANLHEQLRTIRSARRGGAEILILECMAVNPQLQKIAQEQIVRSDITVITNVRYDHIFEMGETLEEIAASLSATIPSHGTLYTAEPEARRYFEDECRRKDCRLVLCPPTGTAGENIGIARAVSASFGVSEQEFQASLSRVKEDFGVRRLYETTNKMGEVIHFLNLFSANDPQSTASLVDDCVKNGVFSSLAFLYNHRTDRPDRALLFARHFFPRYEGCTVYISGKGSALPRRLFLQEDVRIAADWRACLGGLPAGSLLVGVGNIKGAGYQMIETLEKERLCMANP